MPELIGNPYLQGGFALLNALNQYGQQTGAFMGNLGLLALQRGLINQYEGRAMGDFASQERAGMGGIRNLNATLRGIFENQAAGTTGRFGNLAANLQAGYGNIANRYIGLGESRRAELENRFRRDLLGTAERRYTKGMAMLAGAGEQQRKDIGRQYDEASAAESARMAAAGLGATTVAAGARGAVERERSGALGRLEESLRGERLATHAALSGDVLQTQGAGLNLATQLSGENLSRGLGLEIGGLDLRRQMGLEGLNLEQILGGQRLGLMETTGLRELGMQQDYWGQLNALNRDVLNARLGLYGGVNIGYPDPGTYLNTQSDYGTASVNPYQAPSGGLFGLGAGGSAGVGAGVGAGTYLLGSALTGGMFSPIDFGLSAGLGAAGGYGFGLF